MTNQHTFVGRVSGLLEQRALTITEFAERAGLAFINGCFGERYLRRLRA